MATVPEYRRQIDLRPVNQQTVQVNTSPNTFGAQVGQATQVAGQAVTKAAAALDYRDQLTEDAKAREAFNAYRYGQREAMSAPETGYLNRTGGNALGVQTTAEERLRALREQHAEGLAPRARRKYDAMVDELQDQAHGSLLAHTSGEARNYIVNQRLATIAGYAEEAATDWNNQDLFERNLGLAINEQEQLANLQGWDAATRRQSAETLVSSAFRQRIVLAASEDPIAAQALLAQSRDMLSAEDEHALDTGLKSLVLEERASRFTQQFVRSGRQGGVAGGQRDSARYDAIDRPNDGVAVTFAMGSHRPERPNQEIADVITSAAKATFGPGTRVVVGSGAEGELPQHGSDRHQTGMAADVAIYRPDGTLVLATDADAPQFARAAAQGGALGIGYGAEYMGGSNFHIDMVMPGGGQSHVWKSGALAIGPELVAIMDRGAASTLAASSYENSPVNRGIVNQFGEQLGLAVVAAAQNTPHTAAGSVLPPEAMAANPNFAGMTIGEVYDTVATAIGDDPATRMGRAYFDAQGAYEAALTIEDADLRAEALRRIDTMAALQDRARTEGRREAQEAAWTEYAATGRTDFPLGMRQAMGQSGWTTFLAAVRNDQAGTASTDPATWDTLFEVASRDPSAFAAVNLEAHRASLSVEDQRYFKRLQEAALADAKNAQKAVAAGRNAIDYTAAFTAADSVYAAMVDKTPVARMSTEQLKRRMNFQADLANMVEEFYVREGREGRESRGPNVREVREMASVLALPVEYYRPGAGFIGGAFDGVNELGSGKLFDAARRAPDTRYRIAVKYESIPLADRARITTQLMQVNGGELPTPDDVTEAYEQQRLLSVGLPPNVDIGAVPEWVIEIERGANPDVTDDELVERYQLFLMSQ